MRTRLLVGGCAAILAGPVSAQSSVTLYGSVDVGIDFVSNSQGKQLYQVSSGKRTPDRWGLLIKEDLGGGNSAFARLEAGFVTNSGAQINPTSFFNRDAYVGVSNNRWGSLSLGNIDDYIYQYVGRLNNSVPGISSFYNPGNLDGLANTHALNNAVKYETINFHGFQAGVMNAFGNQAGNFSAGRQYSFGAQYLKGPVMLGVAYTMSHDRTADIFGTFSLRSLLGQPLKQGTMFNASSYSTLAAGGSVKIGRFTPHVTYSGVKLENSKGSATLNNYQAGVNTDLTGNGIYILGLSWSHSLFQGLVINQYNLFATDYLSKSTQVYAGVGLQRASGPGARAAQFGYQPSTTGSQTVARIGLNHTF
ncbi:putative porin [Paraburkholderia atlantica]|uniref:Putative porin n=1 Tax=Paraburkholderia atlantica TaxID=2654982 RepID=A0A7W8Q6N5_PARAM|nr:porin [Paraburkholderia atlantica]MBB5424131.1 putative porin [Paraburkholderia atlantica]NUY31058.1 porin [Paraburkholderia atlantica]